MMSRVPNILHFCYGFADSPEHREFGLAHYLAIKSAVAVNSPDATYIYYKYEPQGPWWKKARELLVPVGVEPPRSIFGRPLVHPAHQADVFRLQRLIECGGIYLDIDTICVRPFSLLRQFSFVMGEEAKGGPGSRVSGLCNAVILSEANSRFAIEWLNGHDPARSLFEGFRSVGRDEYWNEFSVKYPAHLARALPESIHIEGCESFFWPSWTDEGLRMLFEDGAGYTFDRAYCHHLWAQRAWDRYLRNLTPQSIRESRSPYGLIARRFL